MSEQEPIPEGKPEGGATGAAELRETAAPEPERAAKFPTGFWLRVDYMLQHPDEILESLRQDTGLWPMSRIFIMLAIVMSAIYGAIMGATNFLQGSPMPVSDQLKVIVATAVKVPVLFLLTLAIVLPPIYVSNCFQGARHNFRVIVTGLLAAMATNSVVLASMASVALFFALTSSTYDFIKLLHVLFFAYAGVAGLMYLFACVQRMASDLGRFTPTALFVAWLLLYGFVGTQLAWVMRPFIAAPDKKFELFRAREGNFYESVGHSLKSFLTDQDAKGQKARR